MPARLGHKSSESTILKRLSGQRVDVEKIAFTVVHRPRAIPVLVESLQSQTPRTRHGAAKALKLVSEREPRLLYPYFDSFVRLLDCNNTFLRWEAMRILSNLAPIDFQEKLTGILDRYLDSITDREMIGAANCIPSAARIAQAKPHLADAIAREILKVEHGVYRTAECRNVAIGHAITAFDHSFREMMKSRQDVIEFVTRQLQNPRPATRKKAEAFLKTWID